MKRVRSVAAAVLALFWIAGTVQGQGLPDLGGWRAAAESTPAPAQPQYGDSRDRVRVSVVPQRTKVAPGDEIALAVVFDHDPGWHIYAGDQPLPDIYTRTRIHAEAGSPLRAHVPFVQWPDFKTIEFFGDELPVYEGRAIVYLPVTVAADAPLGTARLIVRPVFQVCDDVQCLFPTPQPPQRGEQASAAWEEYGYTIELEVVESLHEAAVGAEFADAALFDGFDRAVWAKIESGGLPPQIVSFGLFELNVAGWIGLAMLLLVAAVGGFILNFTPCVLPVIPIKVLSLSQAAGNRARCFALGSAMAIGVVALWLAVGVAIASFQFITSTNELFQYPLFTISVGVVLVLMAVGMCGLFSMRLPDWVYSVSPRHDTYSGSFGFGVMTGVLALPCTAPFMGAAIAVAAGWSSAMALSVFLAIGVGMAVPYLVLTAFPQMIDRLPRTGPGSELLKQVMGLLILAAAAFFLGVGLSGLLMRAPDPASLAYWWAVAVMVGLAGLWLAWRTLRIARRTGPKIVFGLMGLAMIATAAAGAYRLTDKGPIDWVYFTPERLEEELAAGNVVVLEFTAEWCLNCKLLERTVLFTPDVVQSMHQPGVVPMKIDLTGRNPVGNAKLNSLGRHSIPLLVVLRPDGEPVFTEDWYTAYQVLGAIERAQALPALAAGD